MVQYEIGKMKKLIDLNGQSTNFHINFTVVSLDGSEFEMLVLDQTTLDNNPEFNYKKVKGSISGNVVSDKNIYQNHFLILKADKPTKVDVVIEKRELPYNQDFMNQQMDRMKQEMQQQTQPEIQQPNNLIPSNLQNQMMSNDDNTPKKSSKLFLFIILIIIGILIYFFVLKNNTSATSSSSVIEAPVILPIPNESLLSRLNNLEF
jgi:hypothetical protein